MALEYSYTALDLLGDDGQPHCFLMLSDNVDLLKYLFSQLSEDAPVIADYTASPAKQSC